MLAYKNFGCTNDGLFGSVVQTVGVGQEFGDADLGVFVVVGMCLHIMVHFEGIFLPVSPSAHSAGCLGKKAVNCGKGAVLMQALNFDFVGSQVK